jgi:hypothetical protein
LFYKQIKFLEWADDLQMHHLKGYGGPLNYHMGVPLLEDVVQSMDRAMATLKGLSTSWCFLLLGKKKLNRKIHLNSISIQQLN